MTLRHIHGRTVTEDVSDVQQWLHGLQGCPEVTETAVISCANHPDEPGCWFYVEADAANGVARVRCLRCGLVQHLLDSEQRWSFPPTWSCVNCAQSIAEVVVGGHEIDGRAEWIAVAVRCVDCGGIAGVTDAVVADGSPISAVFGTTPVATV